jgi:TonB family protein
MSRFKGYGPLIAGAGIGLIVAVLAEPVSKWIASRHGSNSEMVIGKIVKAEGSVRRLYGGDLEQVPSPVVQPLELRDGDRLQTGADSSATVILNSKDEFEIHQGSSVQFQLWNARDANSPIYMTLMVGEPTLRSPGVHGRLYVVKEGRLSLPGQARPRKAMALTVLRNAPLDLHLAAQEPPPAGAEDTDSALETGPSNPPAVEPDTLSNDYIDETIAGQQGLLQKCWLTRLKDAPNSKGQIVVQFEITKRGRVKDAHVADSSLEDDALKKCVVSVFERMVFRPFKGSEISLSYPINFE